MANEQGRERGASSWISSIAQDRRGRFTPEGTTEQGQGVSESAAGENSATELGGANSAPIFIGRTGNILSYWSGDVIVRAIESGSERSTTFVPAQERKDTETTASPEPQQNRKEPTE